jgi:hypothetical protein
MPDRPLAPRQTNASGPYRRSADPDNTVVSKTAARGSTPRFPAPKKPRQMELFHMVEAMLGRSVLCGRSAWIRWNPLRLVQSGH